MVGIGTPKTTYRSYEGPMWCVLSSLLGKLFTIARAASMVMLLYHSSQLGRLWAGPQSRWWAASGHSQCCIKSLLCFPWKNKNKGHCCAVHLVASSARRVDLRSLSWRLHFVWIFILNNIVKGELSCSWMGRMMVVRSHNIRSSNYRFDICVQHKYGLFSRRSRQ